MKDLRSRHAANIAGATIVAKENMAEYKKIKKYKDELDALKESGGFDYNEGLTTEESHRLAKGSTAHPSRMEISLELDETMNRLQREKRERVEAGGEGRLFNPEHLRGVIILKESGSQYDNFISKAINN